MSTSYWTDTDAFLHEPEKIGIAVGQALEADQSIMS
jgi:hypothetical protein